MAITYLHNTPWEQITREERFFCGRLFELVRRAPGDFANWVSSHANVGLPARGEWDIGFEVALYRDLLWQRGRRATGEGFSPKRTFDLCLFHESCVVIIEAKVAEPFDHHQATLFEKDRVQIPRLLGEELEVVLVGLASSQYFDNERRYGRAGTLEIFDALITWKDVAERFPDSVLAGADRIYKGKPLHPLPLQQSELEGIPLYPEKEQLT